MQVITIEHFSSFALFTALLLCNFTEEDLRRQPCNTAPPKYIKMLFLAKQKHRKMRDSPAPAYWPLSFKKIPISACALTVL